MVVVPTGQVEVVVAKLVEDHPFQVLLVKLSVHQRVDVNMVVSQVVTAPGRLQPVVEENPVQKRPSEIFQRPLLSQTL